MTVKYGGEVWRRGMAVAEEGKLKCFVPNIPESIMRGYENASFSDSCIQRQ